jgi:glyoxylase-like metal-dependent hydrolase (beta-lactamase superfamily II)
MDTMGSMSAFGEHDMPGMGGDMFSFTATSFAGSRYFELQELADGVWAAVAVPGTGAWGNAGIIDLGGQTLVFDTFATPGAGADLAAAAEHYTGRPATWVINSHNHFDHVFGNQAFPQAQIISTGRAHELIVTRGAALIEQAKAHPEFLDSLRRDLAAATEEHRRRELENQLGEYSALDAALPSLQLRPPTLTFDSRLVFHGTKRTAELITYGGGHTDGDAFLYLPLERIAFLGDLVQVNNHPSMDQGNPESWDSILEQIGRLDLETVVPGHGTVGDQWAVVRMRQYLTDLQNMVLALRGAGGDADQAAALPIPTPYAGWEAPSNFNASLRFLYDHLAALPLTDSDDDTPAIEPEV